MPRFDSLVSASSVPMIATPSPSRMPLTHRRAHRGQIDLGDHLPRRGAKAASDADQHGVDLRACRRRR